MLRYPVSYIHVIKEKWVRTMTTLIIKSIRDTKVKLGIREVPSHVFSHGFLPDESTPLFCGS